MLSVTSNSVTSPAAADPLDRSAGRTGFEVRLTQVSRYRFRVRSDTPEPFRPAATETAVIVAIPEAEPLVGEHRQRFDEAAALGVPAHVTILSPFVAPAAVDAHVIATLGAAALSVPIFDCSFASTSWFGREVLWLAPDPAEPFRRLTAAVWAAFPQHPPYGGSYNDIVPHLTVGQTRSGPLSQLETVERTVQADLPVRASVASLMLMAGTSTPSSWHVRAEFPLSARTDARSR